MRRGVRVRRLVRRFELWSIAKIALFFHAICGAISLGVSILLWHLLVRLGSVEKFESFLSDLLGTADFQIDSRVLMKAAIGITGALVLLNVVMTVLLAFIYNMLSGLFGGVVVAVIEERALKKRRFFKRRKQKTKTATDGGRRRSTTPAGVPAGATPNVGGADGLPAAAMVAQQNGATTVRNGSSPVEVALAQSDPDLTDGWMRAPSTIGLNGKSTPDPSVLWAEPASEAG